MSISGLTVIGSLFPNNTSSKGMIDANEKSENTTEKKVKNTVKATCLL
jgi:hypothetical protein